jgi:hypothetical protein
MKIKVIVLRPSRRFELDINLEMSVQELKSSINDKLEGVEVPSMKLIIQGRVMVDEKKLGDYTAMREGVAIHMVVVPNVSNSNSSERASSETLRSVAAPRSQSDTSRSSSRNSSNLARSIFNTANTGRGRLPESLRNLPSGVTVQQTPFHTLPDGSRMVGMSINLSGLHGVPRFISNSSDLSSVLPANMNELIGNALREAISGATDGESTVTTSTTTDNSNIPTTSTTTTNDDTSDVGRTASFDADNIFGELLNELGSELGIHERAPPITSNSSGNSNTRVASQLSDNPRPTSRRRLTSTSTSSTSGSGSRALQTLSGLSSLERAGRLFDGARRAATNYDSTVTSFVSPPNELSRLGSLLNNVPRELQNLDYHINLAVHNLDSESVLIGEDRTRAQESTQQLRNNLRYYATALNAISDVVDRLEFGNEPGSGTLRDTSSSRSSGGTSTSTSSPFSSSSLLNTFPRLSSLFRSTSGSDGGNATTNNSASNNGGRGTSS